MSFNLIRPESFCHRRPLRLIGYRKLESFHPDGPMFRTPVVGAAPRVCQGLDLDKLVTYPYQPLWKTREKYQGGYKYGERNTQPSVNAMTPEEMITYFDTHNYFGKYTWGELIRACSYRFFRAWVYAITWPFLGIFVLGLYFIPSNRYEAIEYFMPVEEYYENYIWHDFGRYIDKSTYEQYLEARRAKKWGRSPHIDPIDYIPPKYRSEQQKKERGD